MHTDDEIFKKLDPELFEYVVKWWETHGFPVFPSRSMDYGYISVIKGKPIFCTFYFHHDFVAYTSVWVVNPDADHDERIVGMRVLCDGIEDLARRDGVMFLHTFTNNDSLVKRLTENRYIPYDTGITDMMKILKE